MVDQPDPPAASSSSQLEHSEPVSSQSTQQPEASPVIAVNDRIELLEKARTFLNSPQVRHEDHAAKRRFLADKGLNEHEISSLLQELPPQAPLVPPRTYPQPPPSNLPGLLLGVARIFSWVAGGSAALLVVYFRFLYPRMSQTYQARHALRTHQKELLGRLTTSLEMLKATQAETAAVLPRLVVDEEGQYRECHTLDDVLKASNESQEAPGVTLLRCAIADLSDDKKPTTAEAIFLVLEGKFSWLRDDAGSVRRERLWQTLTDSTPFHEETIEGTSSWTYTPPSPPPPPPIMQSLCALKSALPTRTGQEPSRFQHTLNALTDLTGYIATRTYDGFRRAVEPGVAQGVEEEVKREIRALKGLVLNRRAFMPNVSRTPSYTPAPPFNPTSVNVSTQ